MSQTASNQDSTPAGSSPEREAMLSILRTASVLSEPFDHLFRRHDLSSPLYNILRILRAAGDQGLAAGAIADEMISPAPDMTRLIDRLEKNELASRHRSEEDRRVVVVRIEPKARLLLRGLDPLVDQLHRDTLAHLTNGELESIKQLMTKARRAP